MSFSITCKVRLRGLLPSSAYPFSKRALVFLFRQLRQSAAEFERGAPAGGGGKKKRYSSRRDLRACSSGMRDASGNGCAGKGDTAQKCSASEASSFNPVPLMAVEVEIDLAQLRELFDDGKVLRPVGASFAGEAPPAGLSAAAALPVPFWAVLCFIIKISYQGRTVPRDGIDHPVVVVQLF